MPLTEINDIETLKTLEGREVAVSDWVALTQDMVNQFASVTLDDQWIHTDVERCKTESPFGAPVAHGYLTLSMLPHLYNISFRLREDFPIHINAGLNKLRFIMPVVAGQRIRSRQKLISVSEVDGGWRVNWRVKIEIEGEKRAALITEAVLRYLRAGSSMSGS
jgi:acyl dehydratase